MSSSVSARRSNVLLRLWLKEFKMVKILIDFDSLMNKKTVIGIDDDEYDNDYNGT